MGEGRQGQLLVAPNHLSLPQRPHEPMHNPGPEPQAPTGRDPGALHPDSVLAGNAVGPAQIHACTLTHRHQDTIIPRHPDVRAPDIRTPGHQDTRHRDTCPPGRDIGTETQGLAPSQLPHLEIPENAAYLQTDPQSPHTRAEPPHAAFGLPYSLELTPHLVPSLIKPSHLRIFFPHLDNSHLHACLHTWAPCCRKSIPYLPGHPYNHITLPGSPPALLHT